MNFSSSSLTGHKGVVVVCRVICCKKKTKMRMESSFFFHKKKGKKETSFSFRFSIGFDSFFFLVFATERERPPCASRRISKTMAAARIFSNSFFLLNHLPYLPIGQCTHTHRGRDAIEQNVFDYNVRKFGRNDDPQCPSFMWMNSA